MSFLAAMAFVASMGFAQAEKGGLELFEHIGSQVQEKETCPACGKEECDCDQGAQNPDQSPEYGKHKKKK